MFSPAGFRVRPIPVQLSEFQEYGLVSSEGIEISPTQLHFAFTFTNPNEGEVVEAATVVPVEILLSGMPDRPELSADLNHDFDGTISAPVRGIKSLGVVFQSEGMGDYLGNIHLPFLHELQGRRELGRGIATDTEITHMQGGTPPPSLG